MPHVPADRLAALADEVPTADEALHLAECAACAREQGAQRRLRALSASLPERDGVLGAPPLTSWTGLAPALRREGLLREPEVIPLPVSPGGAAVHPAARRWRGVAWRAAAAVALLGAGTLLGRASVDGGEATRVAEAPVAAGDGVVEVSAPSIGSESEALAVMARAERDYKRAAAFLAMGEAFAPLPSEPEALRTRLAALDQVGEVTRAALSAAPQDPVINQYYLAALGARAATIRQLDRAAPGVLVGGF